MISIYPKNVEAGYAQKGDFFGILKELTGEDVIPFSCGRAALVYGMQALGFTRRDEILVPSYLGHCVLSALARTSFPTMTPSSATKGILVFHQFGYPQRLDEIQKIAARNKWFIINDCANTMFSSYDGKKVIAWGDFTMLSFAKLYACILGGGLIWHKSAARDIMNENYEMLRASQVARAQSAYEILQKAQENAFGLETEFEIDAVYGYLPRLVAFAPQALAALPASPERIQEDADRRKRLLQIVYSYFPKSVPVHPDSDVVPFAVPISGKEAQLERLSRSIRDKFSVDVPVLHFDFACNMLDPQYRKALVVGCHHQWSQGLVIKICEYLKEYLDEKI